MTYSRVWNDTQPITDSDADQIAIDINDLRGDIHERMADVLGADGDWGTDDPVIPYSMSDLKADMATQQGNTGSVANVERSIPWYNGLIISTAGTVAQSQQSMDMTGASAAITIYIPVVIPVGVTITQARARVFVNNAAHLATVLFKGTTDGVDVYSVSCAAAVVSGSAQWVAPAVAPSQLTATGVQYGFSVVLDNANTATSTPIKIYAVQIKYTHPGGTVR